MDPITPTDGKVSCSSPEALKEAGNAAVAAGDVKRAARMYTIGIDLICKRQGKGKSCQEDKGLKPSELFSLDVESGGTLHLLLSNRSFVHLKLNDFPAAIDDAERCCHCAPGFAKGHMRLLSALQANKSPLSERRRACRRGTLACPMCKDLLKLSAALAKMEATVESTSQLQGTCTDTSGVRTSPADDDGIAAQIRATRACADDLTDPRRAIACGDLGSALATGAHGVEKDLVKAENYLRIGAEGGDAASQRNYGILLLQLGRPVEGAAQLQKAAKQDDKLAASTLQELNTEAEKKKGEAMFKLRELASRGDQRAIAMLKEFS